MEFAGISDNQINQFIDQLGFQWLVQPYILKLEKHGRSFLGIPAGLIVCAKGTGTISALHPELKKEFQTVEIRSEIANADIVFLLISHRRYAPTKVDSRRLRNVSGEIYRNVMNGIFNGTLKTLPGEYSHTSLAMLRNGEVSFYCSSSFKIGGTNSDNPYVRAAKGTIRPGLNELMEEGWRLKKQSVKFNMFKAPFATPIKRVGRLLPLYLIKMNVSVKREEDADIVQAWASIDAPELFLQEVAAWMQKRKWDPWTKIINN